MIDSNRSKKILVASLAIGAVFSVSSIEVTSASAGTLSRVGPTLTSSNVKAQTGFMLRHDASVQRFLGISRSKAYELKVTEAKKFTCRIGYDERCPFNTGKAGTTILQTSFRRGQRRTAYRVTFTYSSVTKTVTFHQLSSNLLSGAKVVKHVKRRVVTNKKITVNVVKYKAVTKAGCDASGSWSVAKVTSSTKKYKVAASSTGWKTLLKLQQSAVSGADSSSSAHCGSGAGGGVKMSCAQLGLIESSPGSGVCQANSASSSQDATVTNDCKGPNTNSSQCNTVINQTTIINQINANCSIVQLGDGSVVYVENGSIVNICSNMKPDNPEPPKPPEGGKDGQPGAGTGNGGGNGNDEPGAGDSGTAPAADCWAIDGNGDPTIPGYWDPILKECKRK